MSARRDLGIGGRHLENELTIQCGPARRGVYVCVCVCVCAALCRRRHTSLAREGEGEGEGVLTLSSPLQCARVCETSVPRFTAWHDNMGYRRNQAMTCCWQGPDRGREGWVGVRGA